MVRHELVSSFTRDIKPNEDQGFGRNDDLSLTGNSNLFFHQAWALAAVELTKGLLLG